MESEVKEQTLEGSQQTNSEQIGHVSSDRKPFYKNPFLYIVLAFILIALGSSALLGQSKTEKNNKQADAGTVEYKTGLNLEHVAVQIPNDEDIEAYPLATFTVGSVSVYNNDFEGLTVYRGTNSEPGLAESWTNPDPTTWRFTLRKGVKFHSGDPFTAEDVKYTIEQAKASEKDKIPWVSQFVAARVESVHIIDDYTVDLKTKYPEATLLRWLQWMGIVSKNQVTRDGLSKAVGTGPYKIVSLAKREATLEANNDYWGGVPKLKKLTYKVIPDPQKAKEALENGTLDILTLTSANNQDLETKGYQVAKFRTGGINWLFLDVNSAKSKYVTGVDKNPFKDKRVRKAMYLVFDIPKLIAESGISAEPVSQFTTEELVGYNPQLKNPTQNLAEAKRLMKEAGFPDGFTVVLDGNKQANQKVSDQIIKQLAQIGINVKSNVSDAEVYYDKLLKTGDFSMLFTYYYPDTLDSLDFIDMLFHERTASEGLFNGSNYSNQELNALINQAKSTFDVDKRIELTRQAHALIMDDLPSIPLYTEIYQIASRDSISYKTSISVILFGFDISGREKINKN